MRDIGQRLCEFIQNYQWWMQIWLPQSCYFTELLYAPTSISKSLSGFPPLPFTLIQHFKVWLPYRKGRACQGPFLGWMWYLWIQYKYHSKAIHSNGSSQNLNPVPVAFPHRLADSNAHTRGTMGREVCIACQRLPVQRHCGITADIKHPDLELGDWGALLYAHGPNPGYVEYSM